MIVFSTPPLRVLLKSFGCSFPIPQATCGKLYTHLDMCLYNQCHEALCTILLLPPPGCKSPKSGNMVAAAGAPLGRISREPEGGPRYGTRYSYRKASAGKILDADHDGYSVAMKDTPTATRVTSTPSRARGANGT